jgi:hypothetical protein
LALPALAALLACPAPVHADGKVFRTAQAVPVATPDQEALIVFDAAAGRETLAIETRFDPGRGAGPGDAATAPAEYAWVVPLPGPGAPAVRPATPGLFPTLRQTFAPEVVTRTGAAAAPLLGLSLFIVFLLAMGAAASRALKVAWFAVAMLPGVLVLGCLLPSLGVARSRLNNATGVAVLSRQLAGRYEVTTVTAEAAGPAAGLGAGHRVAAWLRDGGFALPDGVEPVLAEYAAKGWVFAACRLTAAPGPEGEPPATHPLVFEFATPEAVHPMRLTGVGNGPLTVDLYVFSGRRAAAPGFETVRCEPAVRLETDVVNARYLTGRRVVIRHPLASALVKGQPVGTHLRATLAPAAQGRDVALSWAGPAEVGGRLYAPEAAAAEAVSAGAGVLLAGLLALVVTAGVRSRSCAWTLRRAWAPLAVAAAAGLAWRAALPVHAGRVAGWRDAASVESGHRAVLDDLRGLAASAPRSTVELRAAADERWAKYWSDAARPPHAAVPTRPHHEDSPGNYVIAERPDGGHDYITYDVTGRPSEEPIEPRAGEPAEGAPRRR